MSFSLDAKLSQQVEKVEVYQAIQSDFAAPPARLYAQNPQFQLLTDALQQMQAKLVEQAEQVFAPESAKQLVQVGVRAEIAQYLTNHANDFSSGFGLRV